MTNNYPTDNVFKVDFYVTDTSTRTIIYSKTIWTDLLPSGRSWTRTLYAIIPYSGSNFKFEANATRVPSPNVGDSDRTVVSAEQTFEVPWLDFYFQSIMTTSIVLIIGLLIGFAYLHYRKKRNQYYF